MFNCMYCGEMTENKNHVCSKCENEAKTLNNKRMEKINMNIKETIKMIDDYRRINKCDKIKALKNSVTFDENMICFLSEFSNHKLFIDLLNEKNEVTLDVYLDGWDSILPTSLEVDEDFNLTEFALRKFEKIL